MTGNVKSVIGRSESGGSRTVTAQPESWHGRAGGVFVRGFALLMRVRGRINFIVVPCEGRDPYVDGRTWHKSL